MGNETFRQRQNILTPFTQWWNRDIDDIEAIKEIFTEPSFIHFLRKVPIGGRNNPHINANFPVASNRLNDFFLNGT